FAVDRLRLPLLKALDIPAQIADSELFILSIRQVHSTKDGTPYGHLRRSVRRNGRTKLQHRNDMGVRESSMVLPDQSSQIYRLRLQRRRGWSMTSAIHAMTRRA